MPRLLLAWARVLSVVGCSLLLANLGCSAAASEHPTDPPSIGGHDNTPPFSSATPPPVSSSPPSSPPPSVTKSGGIQLEVDRSTERTLLGRSTDKGTVFLVLSLRVENVSEVSSPFLFAWPRLSLRTKAGLDIGVSNSSTKLVDACPDGVILEPGAPPLTCSIAFEVKQGEADRLILAVPPLSSAETQIVPPVPCNIVSPSGAPSPVPARVSHDDPPALVREALPDGTFMLVRSELYTKRNLTNVAIPPSTVVIRGTLFQEAVFDHVVSRTMGRLDDSPEGVTSVRVSCESPTRGGEAEQDEAHDTLYYSKVERELVLERVTSEGLLRRIYR